MINAMKKISAITIFSLIINIFSFTQAKAATDGNYSCSISGTFSVISNAVVGNNNTCAGAAVIPDGVTSIGDSAFENSSLSYVTIPDSVTSIGVSAFRNTPLISVTIPDSVLTIGIAAFRANTALTTVTIGNSVTTIGQDAFTGNTALATVTIGNSVTLIQQGAFRDAALVSVTIPNSVVTIGNEAFFRNTALTSVTIGNSVTTIGAYAFGNTALSSVKFLGNAPSTINNNNFGDANASPGATAIVSSSASGFNLDVNDSNPGDNKWYGLIVSPVLAPAFTLSASSESRTVNTAATGFVVNSTGGAIESFAINQTPPGMSFNTSTGTLTGTPNTVAATTAYTITATNLSGSTTQTFTLTVSAALAAPVFTLSSSTESRTVNTAITGYTISSTGGTIASYAISPAAPAGLTFNTTTGLLSGTPTEVAASTAYTITATNATSSTTQTFTLTVTAAAVVADNSAAQAAAQAEAARRANEQRQMGDLSSVLPLINELIKEIEDGLKSTSAPKKKSSTSKTKQSSQAKPEKKSNSEPLTIPIPPATEPEAQSQVGELVSISHKVGFGLSASWINSSNIKALRGFIAGIEESFEVERIVIQGYAQPTKIGLPDIDIARAKAVKKLLIKDGLDYPIVVEGMGQAESKKGDLSRIAVVTVEGKLKNQN